jgi:two-component sensor histidine kinase
MLFMQAIDRATGTRDAPSALAANLGFVDRIDVMAFRPVGVVARRERPAADETADSMDGRTPGLVRMAEAASRLSGPRGDILSQLLRATCAPVEGAGGALRPVWAFENVARTGVMIRLLASLDRQRRNGSPHMPSPDMERDAADRLSAGLSLVRDLSAADPVPCSTVLRHVVCDLVELFGPTVGEVSVATQVEPVAMDNLKRRALVLVVCNLLLHAIADGFAGRRSGALVVSLQRTGGARLRLTVADNGSAWARDWPEESGEAIDDLATVLGGRVVHQWDGRGGMISELTFPV